MVARIRDIHIASRVIHRDTTTTGNLFPTPTEPRGGEFQLTRRGTLAAEHFFVDMRAVGQGGSGPEQKTYKG